MNNPYYIVAPDYNRLSSGVMILHNLCHLLNEAGEMAFIATSRKVHPDLFTPPASQSVINKQKEEGLEPIVVYPESYIAGNPLGGKHVVRYLLNYPGALGGDKVYEKTDMIWSYSRELLVDQDTKYQENILDIPVIPTNIFYPPMGIPHRSGICFYAEKYRRWSNDVHHERSQNCTEIYGASCGRLAQSKEQVAEIFRRSEMFYCYESSALIDEATLCGCPVTLMRTPHFKEVIGGVIPGAEWNYSGKNPWSTLNGAKMHYGIRMRNVFLQLNKFIEATQNWS
jgi:hypothetical protein